MILAAGLPILLAAVTAASSGGRPARMTTAPNLAACGEGKGIPSAKVDVVLTSALRSIVLETSRDFGGERAWCARREPVYVISHHRVEIGGCSRIVPVASAEDALQRVGSNQADYVRIEVTEVDQNHALDFVVERGRVSKRSDAVQVRVRGKPSVPDDRPTLFREESSRYRVVLSHGQVAVCRYSNVVI